MNENQNPRVGMEEAALFALACMTEKERRAYRQLLKHNEPALQEVLSFEPVLRALGSLEPEMDPPASLKPRLMAKIEQEKAAKPAREEPKWKRWPDNEKLPLTLVPSTSSEWENTPFPGVYVKRLFVAKNEDQITMLVRMDPNTSYPAHVHGGPETCFVLEGDLHSSNFSMKKGDFQRSEPGSVHDAQYTKEGCVVLITSSLRDQVLA